MDKRDPIPVVVFYKTEHDREPVREWLKSLRMEDKKEIGQDIKDGIARIFFTVDGATMVLLHGFVKKSQATPQGELDLARERERGNTMANKHKGSEFDTFLKEEGLLAEAEAAATKRVLAHQIEMAMKKRRLSKMSMAQRMRTSRSALDRLLDPSNSSVTLQTLERAAIVLGKKLKISLT